MKYFINYASNGFTNSQNIGLKSASQFGFKSIGYTNLDLDKEFITKNNKILSSSRGAGYWLWKPYIILDMLNKINDDDYLIYMDSGACLTGDPTNYLEMIDDKGILSFSMVQKTSKWTKGDCFFEINQVNKNDFAESNQIQGTYIFLRKCDYSVSFVKRWLFLCEKENLITDQPNINMGNFSDFIDHRHDQSILSLLIYNKSIMNIPQIDQYCVEHGLDISRQIINRHGIRN
jgi:hypothetical protein